MTTAVRNNTVVRDVTLLAKNFLKEKYNMDLNIPIEINGRLSSTFGRFRYWTERSRYGKKAMKIELSSKLVEYHNVETIIDVLYHELIHYVCFEQGKPHKDGQSYFENELRKHGVASTRTYSYKGKGHEYACSCCGKTVKQKRRFDVTRYRSRCCKERFVYKGEIVMG